MEDLRWVGMTDGEIKEFLGNGGTGVISFATGEGESPFSIPISYGYEAGSTQFYYELSMPSEGGKADVLGGPVTFVVHGETETGWRSVVATGELEPVDESPYESATVQGMWSVDIPRVDVFDRPPEDVTFRTFRLVPKKLTGRKEVGGE